MLPGYLDGFEPPVDPTTLVDATAWMDEPLFWPAFLHSFGGSAAAPTAFAADPADVEDYLHRLHRADAWPVVTLHLGGGHRMHLVWRNYEDDSGWDYLLTPADATAPVAVAALEGHFRGPAMSWPELASLATRRDGDRSHAERLLLLLPGYGDAETPDTAHGLVAAALGDVGVVRGHRQVATELLQANRRFWGSPAWLDVDGVAACPNGYSLRTTAMADEDRKVLVDIFGIR